jgi:hypothetical protein
MKYTVLTNGDVIKTKNELARTFIQTHGEHAVLKDDLTKMKATIKSQSHLDWFALGVRVEMEKTGYAFDKKVALELLAKAVNAGVITQDDVDALSTSPVRPTVSVVK